MKGLETAIVAGLHGELVVMVLNATLLGHEFVGSNWVPSKRILGLLCFFIGS